MAKTTPEHFSIFKKECRYWIDKFGLKDWDITFRQMSIESDDLDSVTGAECVADFRNRVAALILQADWGNVVKVTNQIVKAMAFHEVCHVLLWSLMQLALQRSVTVEEIKTETHAIIRRLEGAVLKFK